MIMCRVLLAAVLLWVMVTSASQSHAVETKPLFFVAIAEVLPDQQSKYDGFIEAVVPIWQRHGMRLISRLRIIDAQSTDTVVDRPHELMLIEVGSREGFNAYLADDDYKKIRQDRIDSVLSLVVLEAHPVGGTDRMHFLETAPLAATLLASGGVPNSQAALALEISHVGPVKGPVSPFIRQLKRVEFFAVSFDDNPMDYAETNSSDAMGGESLFLIGERLN